MRTGKLRTVRAEISRVVGREAAGDDERRAAFRALGVERCKAFHAVGPRLEARVHRTHDDSVGQHCDAEVERLEEVGVHEKGNRALTPILISQDKDGSRDDQRRAGEHEECDGFTEE
jgi:hypothetical protein